MIRTLSVFVLAAAAAFAADVTGKWTATQETPRGEMKVNFNFKADGDKLTGTIGNDMMGETEIKDGKINGDAIEFKQTIKRGDREMTVLYTGKVTGDEITFTRKMEGGGGFAGKKGGGGKRGGKGGGGFSAELKATRVK
jgi:hypothetical protein